MITSGSSVEAKLIAIVMSEDSDLNDTIVSYLRQKGYRMFNINYASKEVLIFDPYDTSRPVTHTTALTALKLRRVRAIIFADSWRDLKKSSSVQVDIFDGKHITRYDVTN